MAQHADDGRVLAFDKDAKIKVREFPHIIKVAKNLEEYDSKRHKDKPTQVTEPQRPSATNAAKKKENG